MTASAIGLREFDVNTLLDNVALPAYPFAGLWRRQFGRELDEMLVLQRGTPVVMHVSHYRLRAALEEAASKGLVPIRAESYRTNLPLRITFGREQQDQKASHDPSC